MKKYTRFFAAVMSIMLLTNACTDKYPEINTNPVALTPLNFDPNSLLTSVQLTYTGSTDLAFEVSRTNFGVASAAIQLMAYVGTTWPGDKYDNNNDSFHAYWNRAYAEQVKPVVELVEFTKGKSQYANLHQIGRIMKAMIFQRITDLYGDIPYSQAGLGYYQQILYPVYDKQEVVYKDIIKELEEASAAINLTGDKPTGDAMYAGDLAKWQRFGYTLLLRAGMRLVKVDEVTAKATVAKAVGKTMSSNADNAFVKGSGSGIDRTVNNRNAQLLLGEVGSGQHFYSKWSKTFIDFLKNNNDPRLTRVARVNVWLGANPNTITPNTNPISLAAAQKGLPNGKSLSVNDPVNSIYFDPSYTGAVNDPAGLNAYSGINLTMAQRTSPTFFLTFAESELLFAEAAVRWGNTFGGNPADRYNAGVRAAMTYMSQYDASLAITEAEANTYLAARPYSPAQAIQQINTQLWAHAGSSLNFYEAWSNWRRTGFPVLTPVNYPGNFTGGTIPRRLTYPLGESSTNEKNLNIARAAITGGDFITSRVWWDK